MKKGDVHYIVFTNDGQIEKINSIDDYFRQDVKLILKRTFIKHSGGQQLFDYYKNQVLDANLKIVKSNTFKWNRLSCKIILDECWTNYDIKKELYSVCLSLEVKDHLNKKNVYKINMAVYDVFEVLKHNLEILDRVGTHQGLIEILKLENELRSLERKYNKLNRDLTPSKK